MPAKGKKPHFLNQIIKILTIFIIAGIISTLLILTKPSPKRKQIKLLPSTVTVKIVQPTSENIWIKTMGVVQPVQELSIISEVGGRVEWINKKLIPGGFINKGEVIAKIEKTDYEIAIEQSKANLATARKDLLVEEGAARSAKVMEDMSKISTSQQAKELRMRVPHIEAAESNLNAAKKLLEQAEKDLKRTDIIAPFPILIESENIEIGNYVTKLSAIAQATGTSAYWVKVTLPVSKIYYINIPGVNDKKGSNAKIIFKGTNGKKTIKNGKVVRLFGSLDNTGRMAKILIEVDDPLGIESGNLDEMLLLNSYVQVEIEGKKLSGMVELPREYLRDGKFVWLADKDNRLVIKKIDIAWRDKDKIIVSGGLKKGDKVITSSNFIPVNGMKLSIENNHKQKRGINEEQH